MGSLEDSFRKQNISNMKLTVCALLFLGVLAIVRAENCGNTGDCSHVTCPENDYTLECHNHQCTCTHSTATCSNQADCTSNGSCSNGWHCVDSKCRCFHFGGNGK